MWSMCVCVALTIAGVVVMWEWSIGGGFLLVVAGAYVGVLAVADADDELEGGA